MCGHESTRPISRVSTGIYGSLLSDRGNRILWCRELKNFFLRMIVLYSDSSPAIPSPTRRHVWSALCSGNIGSALQRRNMLPECGGGASSSRPMPRRSLDFLTAVSQSWTNPYTIRDRLTVYTERQDISSVANAAGIHARSGRIGEHTGRHKCILCPYNFDEECLKRKVSNPGSAKPAVQTEAKYDRSR